MNRGLTITNRIYDMFILKNTKNCKTVLDLGCGRNSGSDSIVRKMKWVKRSVGVDIYKPYLDECPEKMVHTELVHSDILVYLKKCGDDSFDAVLLLDVLEHQRKDKAVRIISEAKRVARRVVVVGTPNGFQSQESYEGNLYQEHLCGFDEFDLWKLGFNVKYLKSVLNYLRDEDGFYLLGVYKKI